MKILICGAGSIGKRHIANSLNLKLDVLVWRKRINYRNDLKKFKNLKIFNDLDTAINLSDCVIVATSTVDHDLIISKVIKFKKPLYIEKPISNNLRIINKLKKYNKKNVIHNGFQFRYHQNLIFFKKKINNKFLKSFFFF